MLRAGGEQINPRRLNAAMPQHRRQRRHVPVHPVMRPGEQMAQIVGEHLRGRNPRGFAQRFQVRPDLMPAQAFSASGEKYLAGGDFVFPGVL